MAKYTPRPGSTTELVAQHLDKTNDEILAIAKSREINVSRATIDSARFRLKRSGITKPILALKSDPPPKPNGKPASAPRRAPDDARSEADVNAAALRRLIFKMGYDAARQVFDEFQAAYERMRQ